VYELLAWLQSSALGHAVRSAGVWAYGVINLTHILGVSSLFGAILVLDLRLLGFWRSVALSSISRPTVPIAATGFAVAAASGICMLATNGTEYVGNPFIYIKFPAIALGLINIAVLNFSTSWRAHRKRDLSPKELSQLKIFGGLSLACWVTAISAGRMIGYW
jgi:hypothetical protein